MVKKYILMISLISLGLHYGINAMNQPSSWESFKTNAPTLLQSIQSKITYTKTEFAKLDLEWQKLIKMRIGLNCARLGLFGVIFYQIHQLNKQLDKIIEKRERNNQSISCIEKKFEEMKTITSNNEKCVGPSEPQESKERKYISGTTRTSTTPSRSGPCEAPCLPLCELEN